MTSDFSPKCTCNAMYFSLQSNVYVNSFLDIVLILLRCPTFDGVITNLYFRVEDMQALQKKNHLFYLKKKKTDRQTEKLY